MNIQTESNNKRLLEALDHVDIQYVAELVDGLRLPKSEDGRKGIRTFRHAKQLALIAACALLLGAAIPTVQYVLPMVNAVLGGNAGAGSENIDNTDCFNYSNDMSVDEVLADVIAKGYFVISDGACISGREKWDDFLKSVEKGEPSTVKIAYHESYEWVASHNAYSHVNLDNYPSISLRSVDYNGKTFKYASKMHHLDVIFEKEYPYFISFDSATGLTTYYVSMLTKDEWGKPDPSNPFAKACGHGSTISNILTDQCDCLKTVVFFD